MAVTQIPLNHGNRPEATAPFRGGHDRPPARCDRVFRTLKLFNPADSRRFGFQDGFQGFGAGSRGWAISSGPSSGGKPKKARRDPPAGLAKFD